jgi:hypothetical protein
MTRMREKPWPHQKAWQGAYRLPSVEALTGSMAKTEAMRTSNGISTGQATTASPTKPLGQRSGHQCRGGGRAGRTAPRRHVLASCGNILLALCTRLGSRSCCQNLGVGGTSRVALLPPHPAEPVGQRLLAELTSDSSARGSSGQHSHRFTRPQLILVILFLLLENMMSLNEELSKINRTPSCSP